MALYSPKVREGAIPPLNYPPTFTFVKAAKGFALLSCSHTAVALISGSISAPVVLPPPIIATVHLLVSLTCGYAYISSTVLGRNEVFGSRYSPDMSEFSKLLMSTPLLYALGPMWHTIDVPLQQSSSFFYLYIDVLSFFIGLHFIFLDNSPLLQSLGCKFPVPSRWKDMTRGEFLVAILCFSVLIFFAMGHIQLLMSDELKRAWVLSMYSTAGGFIGAGSVIYRKTHNVHFHHYLIGLCVLPITCFDTAPSRILRAASIAVFTEGIATWGMDPVFVHTETNKASDFTMKTSYCSASI